MDQKGLKRGETDTKKLKKKNLPFDSIDNIDPREPHVGDVQLFLKVPQVSYLGLGINSEEIVNHLFLQGSPSVT